ncbi:MAG TPA: hypothetical protein PLW97_13675, partial [Synergistaceae bacterium]|nr:hypothetical protein [Synergistaceae bacterium]
MTPKNIMSLKIWGVSEVFVADSPETGFEEEGAFLKNPEILEKARHGVLELFGESFPESVGMKEIYRVGVREAARRLAEKDMPFSGEAKSFFVPQISSAHAGEDENFTLEGLVEMEVQLVSFPE